MLKFVDDVKLKAGVWLRERKDRAEEKKAAKAALMNSEHGHGHFFLLTVPATATIFAAIVEVYWAFLFCIEATGHLLLDWSTSVGSDTASTGAWHFAFTVNSVAVLIGLACATVPIVMISMVWLPVQFTMRGTGRWRRGTMIFCGLLANLLVIVSGTVVMNGNRQEQVREGVVAEQSAAQGRAAIDARLAFEQEQLRLALNNTNPYLNQAANVGAAEWERSYVAQARATNDPRLPQLERALGAARAADERRANIERLTVERAQAAPEAATAVNVEDTAGQSLNQFATAVQVWRPPFVAFICTLVGIFGSWWVIALMQGLNPRDVLRSGWADESHRIEDLRDQPSVAAEPMKPPREAIYDAETGEELVQFKGGFRRKPKKKGVRESMETAPEIPPDERGVEVDGGNRIGSIAESINDLGMISGTGAEDVVEKGANDANDQRQGDESSSEAGRDWVENQTNADQGADTGNTQDAGDSLQSSDTIEQPDLPELTPELADYLTNEDAPAEQEQQERQPETDPAKLISSVAAE